MSRITNILNLLSKLYEATDVVPVNGGTMLFTPLSVRAFKKVFPKDSFELSKDKSVMTVKLNDEAFTVKQMVDPNSKYIFNVKNKANKFLRVFMPNTDLERQGNVEANVNRLFDRLKEMSYDKETQKLSVEEAQRVMSDILKTKNKYEPKTVTVDWGSGRGQGKRVGSMVTGGMSDIRGKIDYNNVFSNLPDYEKLVSAKETKDDIGIITSFDFKQDTPEVYLKARSYGLGHEDSMTIVYLYNK